MGLDMYLSRKSYYFGQYRGDGKFADPHELNIEGPFSDRHHIRKENVSMIETQVGYWRKANSVHKFFVDMVQNGKDDCNEYEVPQKVIRLLRMKANKILNANYASRIGLKGSGVSEECKRVAKKHLPPSEGFFFGSYDMDRWYIEDLERTVEICNDALFSKADLYYRASW